MGSQRRGRLLLLVLSCIACVGASELILRATEDGRPWKRRFSEDAALISASPTVYDPAIGTRFNPGWTGKYYYAGDSRFTSLRFNSYGFRFPEYDVAKNGSFRVALLGDSLVAGLQVQADSHFRALLEGFLDRDGPAEVMNFAIPGSGPVAQLSTYRKYVSKFGPDVVVLGITTLNDFLDNIGLAWKRPDGSLLDAPFRRAPGNLGKFLKTNSSLVMALWSVSRRRHYEAFFRSKTVPIDGAGAETQARSYDSVPAWRLAEVSKADYDNTLDIWDTLGRLVRSGSAQFVVVLFPHNPRLTGDGNWDYRPEKKALQERLAAHFRAQGIPVITGTEILESYQARYGGRPVTKWMDYLSEEGHASLADLLGEVIEKLRTAPAIADRGARPRSSGGAAERANAAGEVGN